MTRVLIDPNLIPEIENSINGVSVSLGDIASVLGSVNYGGRNIATAELLVPVLVSLAIIKFKEALQPGSIEAAENNGLFNSKEYLKNMTSQYWGASGPTQEFWDKLGESLQKAVNDLSPSNDYEYMANASFVRIDSGAPLYLFTITTYGGNNSTEYGWLHVNCQRNPNNNGFYVVECDMTYYIGTKANTETQYWVMMLDPLGIVQGNSHTFKFTTPGNASEYASVHTYYYQFN